jgi:hypothetical protein
MWEKEKKKDEATREEIETEMEKKSPGWMQIKHR